MATALGTSRELISRLENGLPFSKLMALKFEQLQKERGDPNYVMPRHIEGGHTEEAQAPYGTEAQIEAELERQFAAILAAAGGDRNRLGWIAEQMKEHLTPPKSWKTDKPKEGPFVQVKLPSQTQALSTVDMKPIPKTSPGARTA